MLEKQRQEAGDNSQQIQIQNLILNGISEERARIIFKELFDSTISDYTQEAIEIAMSRNKEFERAYIPKLVKENILESFKDPSIQFLLKDAQRAAASTERPVDYELLSELLVHRVKKGNDRNIRAGVSRAVEIVDKISDEALLGLTVLHSILTFSPSSGDITIGLDVLDDIFDKITYLNLPNGNEWLEHLDILNAIRINSFFASDKFIDIFSQVLSGYVVAGVRIDSDAHTKAMKIIEQNQIPPNILASNILVDGYLRLVISNEIGIENLLIIHNVAPNMIHKSPFNQEQKNAVRDILKLYDNSSAIMNKVKEQFSKELNKRKSLKAVSEWWDTLPFSFSITSVGRVLAHANAQRCAPTLPALD